MNTSPLRTAWRALLLGLSLPPVLYGVIQFAAWQQQMLGGLANVSSPQQAFSSPRTRDTDISPVSGQVTNNPVQLAGIETRVAEPALSALVELRPELEAEEPVDKTARGQRSEIRGQRSEVRRQKSEAGSQRYEGRDFFPETTDHGPRTTDHFTPQPRITFRALPLDEPPQSSETARLEAQLVSMRQKLDRLAQAQIERQSNELERATQLMQQLQQTTQMQNLERQIEQLRTQQRSMTAEPPYQRTVPEPPPAEPPRAVEPPRAAEPPPVMKARPANGGDEAFSLQIQDADITQVLDMLAQLSGLNIVPGPGITGKVSVNLQQVTIEQALAIILRAHGYLFEREGNLVYVLTPAEAAARKQLNRKVITKVYNPHYISVKDLHQLITPILTPSLGKVAVTDPPQVGIAQSKDNTGGYGLAQAEALLVQDYAEIIAEVDRIFATMDVPPLQVSIEAKFLSVKLTDAMQLGVNFALLSGSGKDLFVSGDGSLLKTASGFPGTAGSIVPPLAQFAANTAGLKTGFLHGDAAGFIQALETIAETSVIAAPQISVLNKQRAELIIGDRVSYKTLAFNGTQTVESVNFLDAGTKLLLRPFISPDGLIRLEVHPEKSSAVINKDTGLPNQTTTEVTTNVTVREGTTIVIGGLISEEVTDSVNRVPFLGALPLIGAAFRNTTQRAERIELIVLLTPRIVREADAVRQGAGLQDLFEQRAVYFRDSLCPINRSALAHGYFNRARYYYDHGNLLKARRLCYQALQHSPNDLECIQLYNCIEQATRARYGHWVPWTPELPAEGLEDEIDASFPAEPLPPLPSVPPDAAAIRTFPPMAPPAEPIQTAP